MTSSNCKAPWKQGHRERFYQLIVGNSPSIGSEGTGSVNPLSAANYIALEARTLEWLPAFSGQYTPRFVSKDIGSKDTENERTGDAVNFQDIANVT